jgi:hypothetical protein
MTSLRNAGLRRLNLSSDVWDGEIGSEYSGCIDSDAKFGFAFNQNVSQHNSTYPKNPYTPTLVEEALFYLTL